MPDRETGTVQIEFIVGERKPHALVIAQARPKRRAVVRIVDRNVVRPTRRPQPAHAMREARRNQPDLRIAEPAPHFAQHG